MSNCFYLGKKVDEVYDELYEAVKENFDDFLELVTDLDGFAAKGMGNLKIADDKLDEILPGYSSFKQYSKAFIILRDSYNYFKNVDDKEKAIQAVVNAQNDKMRWRYATWQMKVNLIYDMRIDETGWVEGFSDKHRCDAVIAVLDSARHDEEFAKIVDRLETPGREVRRESVVIDDLLDFSHKIRYEELKGSHKYIS